MKEPPHTVVEGVAVGVARSDGDTPGEGVSVRVSAMEREGELDTEGEGERVREFSVLAEGVGSAEGTGEALPEKVPVGEPELVTETLRVSLPLAEPVPVVEGERVYCAVPVAASTEGVPVTEEKKEGVESGGEGDSDWGEEPEGRWVPVCALEAEGEPVADEHCEMDGVTDMENVPDTVAVPAAAHREGLLDTELECVLESTADDVADADVLLVRTCVTEGAAVVVGGAEVLAVGDAVGAKVPELRREPLVKGVADPVLRALRVFTAVLDTEGEGEVEGDTVADGDTAGEPDRVADTESVGVTVRDAASLVGDMEAQEDTLALGVREGAVESDEDREADTEGEPEAVVGDADAERVDVCAPEKVPAAERVTRREPLPVGDSVASKLPLGGAVAVGSADHDGEPEGDTVPEKEPLGESDAVAEADDDWHSESVGEAVLVATGVSVFSAVEDTLAVGVTVSVEAALPVFTGVPLRWEALTRAEAEPPRCVKDCEVVGEEEGDFCRDGVPLGDALLDRVPVWEPDALPDTVSVRVPATDGEAGGEGEADAEAQARLEGDTLLEAAGVSVAVMHTLMEMQPEGEGEGDCVREAPALRVAVGDTVPRAVPVASRVSDAPGEGDSEGEPEWLCDTEGEPVGQLVGDTLRLPEPE